MKMILSPAKKMRVNTEEPFCGLPVFLDDAEKIMQWLKKLSYAEKKWGYPNPRGTGGDF